MYRTAQGATLLVFSLLACSDSGKQSEDSDVCLIPNGEPCSKEQVGLYMCNDCGRTFFCTRFNGVDYTWGVSDWSCECIGDSGQLLKWDTATQTGNPDCQSWY